MDRPTAFCFLFWITDIGRTCSQLMALLFVVSLAAIRASFCMGVYGSCIWSESFYCPLEITIVNSNLLNWNIPICDTKQTMSFTCYCWNSHWSLRVKRHDRWLLRTYLINVWVSSAGRATATLLFVLWVLWGIKVHSLSA